MDIYIVAHSKGNRRVRSSSAQDAWRTVCPVDTDAKITELDSSRRKYKVEKGGVRIGHITCIPKGRI